MPRVKRGTHRIKRRKKFLAATKGYMWGRKSKITLMKPAVLKAGAHAYVDRRRKKRDFRALWNVRINAVARANGMKYSELINKLKKTKVKLDRKVLADLAQNEPRVFQKVLEKVKTA